MTCHGAETPHPSRRRCRPAEVPTPTRLVLAPSLPSATPGCPSGRVSLKSLGQGMALARGSYRAPVLTCPLRLPRAWHESLSPGDSDPRPVHAAPEFRALTEAEGIPTVSGGPHHGSTNRGAPMAVIMPPGSVSILEQRPVFRPTRATASPYHF